MANNEIPESGIGAVGRTSDFTNLAEEKSQVQADISTKERMQGKYGLHRDIFDSYLDSIEQSQQEWTKHQVDQKGNETHRGRKIAGTIAEMVIPIAAGTATDALLDAAGAAGGPLVAAAVGAASGGVRAAMEYRHVGAEGQNAAEFWQKNVGSKDKKTESGNALRRGWAHVSRFLKGGSYIGVEAGFKVKSRDEDIKNFMDTMGIQTNENEDTLSAPLEVFGKLEEKYNENPQEFENFVKNLMTQSVLSNFSEQKSLIEQKQMADLFCLANAVLYKKDNENNPVYTTPYQADPDYNSPYQAPTYNIPPQPNANSLSTYAVNPDTPIAQPYQVPEYNVPYQVPEYNVLYQEPTPYEQGTPLSTSTIDRLWLESKDEVKDIISKTRGYFIAGAATERAIKSTVGFFAIKWITQGLEKVSELRALETDNANEIQNTQNLIKENSEDITSTNQDINSLKQQMDSVEIPVPKETVTEVVEIVPKEIDYRAILEPAARASGQDIDTYLSIAERAERINDIPQIAEALSKPETREAINQLSQSLGKSPEQILESGILRWVYDSNRYSDIGELFQNAVDGKGVAMGSIQQALDAAKNVHPAWEDLAKNLMEGSTQEQIKQVVEVVNDNTESLNLLEQLQTQLLDKHDLLNSLLDKQISAETLLKLQQEKAGRILNDVRKAIWETGKRGVVATTAAIIDLITSTEKSDFMYGKKDSPSQPGYPYGGYPGTTYPYGGGPNYESGPDVTVNVETEQIHNSTIGKVSIPRAGTAPFQNPPASGYRRDGWRNGENIRQDSSETYLNTEGNTTQVINEYKQKQSRMYSPIYRKSIETLAEKVSPIKDECRVSIAIPALGEESSMRHALEQFLTLNNPEKFEICILDTHPVSSQDNTESIIREFVSQNPNLNIVYIKRDVEENTNVGESRKFLTDVILERVQRLSDESRKDTHLIISQDADLELFETPDYINTIIEEFERDSNIEVVRGRSNISREALIKAPAVLAAWRTWNTFDLMHDNVSKTVNKTLGTNTVIKARTLAGIGGYNPYLRVAEDLEIGYKIKNLKGNDKIKYSPRFGLQGEARRALIAHLNGVPIINMYYSFHNAHQIRDKSWEEIVNENSSAFEFSPDKYAKELQAIYDYAKNSPAVGPQYSEIFDKTMKAMGVKYRIENDKVIIEELTKNISDVLAEEDRFSQQEQGGSVNQDSDSSQEQTQQNTNESGSTTVDPYWGFSSDATEPSEKGAYLLLNQLNQLKADMENLPTDRQANTLYYKLQRGLINGPGSLTLDEISRLRDVKQSLNSNWGSIYIALQKKVHPDVNGQNGRQKQAEEASVLINNLNRVFTQTV